MPEFHKKGPHFRLHLLSELFLLPPPSPPEFVLCAHQQLSFVHRQARCLLGSSPPTANRLHGPWRRLGDCEQVAQRALTCSPGANAGSLMARSVALRPRLPSAEIPELVQTADDCVPLIVARERVTSTPLLHVSGTRESANSVRPLSITRASILCIRNVDVPVGACHRGWSGCNPRANQCYSSSRKG